MGRSLANSFRVVDLDDSGKFGLKVLIYSDPQEMNEKEEEEAGPSTGFRPMMRNREIQQIVNFLHMFPTDVQYHVSSESDEEEV